MQGSFDFKDKYPYKAGHRNVDTSIKSAKKIKLQKVIKGLNQSMVGWSKTFFLSEKEAKEHIKNAK